MAFSSEPLTNDFSWSKSRHEKLEECARSYYLHYYQSWGGWELEAAASARELYQLKKLSNRWTWAGGVVHDAIKDALLDLRAGREPDVERTVKRAHLLMRRDFAQSRAQLYRTEKLRKNFFGLVEHEYAEAIPDEEWRRNWNATEEALRGFFASRWVPLARGLKAHQWLEVDEGFLVSNFEHHGVKVFAVPDFAYLDDAGNAVVVDWKTGRSKDSGHDAQVLGYAVYLSTRYRLPVESIRTVLVYLNDGAEQTVSVDGSSLAQFEAHFHASVARMRGLLAHPAANVPLGEEAFPRTEDARVCQRCVFRRPCMGVARAVIATPALRAAETPVVPAAEPMPAPAEAFAAGLPG